MTGARRLQIPERPAPVSTSDTDDTLDRRELLRWAGVGLTAMMAGCSALNGAGTETAMPTPTGLPPSPTPTEIPPPRDAESWYDLTGL